MRSKFFKSVIGYRTVFMPTFHYSDMLWASWHLKSGSTQLFVWQLNPANHKETMETPYCWLVVRGIHQWPVDSPHKGLVMQKLFHCNYIIMWFLYGAWAIFQTFCVELQGRLTISIHYEMMCLSVILRGVIWLALKMNHWRVCGWPDNRNLI